MRRRVVAIMALLLVGGFVPAEAAADGNEAPGALAAARSISAGDDHTCALLDDATVKCWGMGAAGQLGQDSTANLGDAPGEMAALQPVNLGTGRTATAITTGSLHTCALLDDATVKCWGTGNAGQLGQDSTATLGDAPGEMAALQPVHLGTGRTATAISAGLFHSCALLDDGSVKCWGANASGQLGQDSTTSLGDAPGEMAALQPVNLGTGRTATAISAGDVHTCALLDDATVKCWGNGGGGRLGQDGTTSLGDGPGEMAALQPVNLGTGRTATAISAGASHTCTLLDNSTVKCWGTGGNGRLGHDSQASLGDQLGEMGTLLPVNLGPGRTARAISAGGSHTCVVLDNSTVKCWGNGANGRLGQDSTDTLGDGPGEMAALQPVHLGAGRTATAVTTGDQHVCAVLDDATVKCWGSGGAGRLGQDTTDTLGDGPGEMAALQPVHLGPGHTVGPVHRLAATLTADQASVVAGADIDYHLTVTNTGGLPLTQVRTIDPDVPDCAATIGALAPEQSVVVDCTYATTAGDVPQMANQALAVSAQGAFALSGIRRTRVVEEVFRPDGHIRLGSGAFAGNNTYNANGAGQTKTTTVPNRGTATFTIRVQNDGNTTQTFTVKGPGATNRYAVTYRKGATNVTAAVVAGTFTTNQLAPGASQNLTLVIKAKAGTPRGAAISRLVTIRSTTDTTKRDAVKATVTRR